jgi:predicted acetyltransferase
MVVCVCARIMETFLNTIYEWMTIFKNQITEESPPTQYSQSITYLYVDRKMQVVGFKLEISSPLVNSFFVI